MISGIYDKQDLISWAKMLHQNIDTLSFGQKLDNLRVANEFVNFVTKQQSIIVDPGVLHPFVLAPLDPKIRNESFHYFSLKDLMDTLEEKEFIQLVMPINDNRLLIKLTGFHPIEMDNFGVCSISNFLFNSRFGNRIIESLALYNNHIKVHPKNMKEKLQQAINKWESFEAEIMETLEFRLKCVELCHLFKRSLINVSMD